MKKLISVITPCYNEEQNVEEVYNQVKKVFSKLDYRYEHLFIDNASKDHTVQILKGIAKKDKNVKVIVNARNFGHIRSPHHAMLQTHSDAVIMMVADLQDPPEIIPEFIKKWENGYEIAIGIKSKSKENFIKFGLRKFFYTIINRFSEIDLIKNYTGFGLYDRKVIEAIKSVHDPYPYFRGLISEVGFEKAKVQYTQPKRNKGKSKNTFYDLYDLAILGLVSNSKIPLRFITITGFIFSIVNIIVALVYLVYKFIHWNSFDVGIAPLVIGLFFFASLQLVFLGVVGEYILQIYTQVKNRPLVIEKERINF